MLDTVVTTTNITAVKLSYRRLKLMVNSLIFNHGHKSTYIEISWLTVKNNNKDVQNARTKLQHAINTLPNVPM